MSKLSREQVSMAAQLTPLRAFAPRDPRLHHFLNKCSGQWLVREEVDGPFGGGESLNLAKFFAYYGVRLVDLEGFEPSTS